MRSNPACSGGCDIAETLLVQARRATRAGRPCRQPLAEEPALSVSEPLAPGEPERVAFPERTLVAEPRDERVQGFTRHPGLREQRLDRARLRTVSRHGGNPPEPA